MQNGVFPQSTNDDGMLQGGSGWQCSPTLVGRRGSIGSNATNIAGITIGERALIGAGSVVIKDTPNDALVVGLPGRVIGDVRDRKRSRETQGE